MKDAEHHLLTLAGGEVHLRAWGAGNRDTVVAWHGLARTGNDFAPLARALADRYRVLAPDAPGRGLSAWAADPSAGYCFAAYEQVAVDLLDAFGADTVRWIGTSMGGALGMRLAAGRLAGRISHLALNDIGPELPEEAVARILTYAGSPPTFATIRDLEAWLRQVYAPFGRLDDQEWRAMALTSWRRSDKGRVALHYDPAIVRQFVDHPDDYRLWPAWEALAVPTLVLRGTESDLLPAQLATAMAERNPRARFLDVSGCGHAPALNVPGQIGPIAGFLDES